MPTAAAGFADQGEVVIKSRQASDLLGATKMDRPEWLAIDPKSGEVYCTLTNNSARGTPGQPGVDAANPRANNQLGQIVRWRETNDDPTATTFRWDMLALAGDPGDATIDCRGDFSTVHRIAAGMASGTIRVAGGVGRHAAEGLVRHH